MNKDRQHHLAALRADLEKQQERDDALEEAQDLLAQAGTLLAGVGPVNGQERAVVSRRIFEHLKRATAG